MANEQKLQQLHSILKTLCDDEVDSSTLSTILHQICSLTKPLTPLHPGDKNADIDPTGTYNVQTLAPSSSPTVDNKLSYGYRATRPEIKQSIATYGDAATPISIVSPTFGTSAGWAAYGVNAIGAGAGYRQRLGNQVRMHRFSLRLVIDSHPAAIYNWPCRLAIVYDRMLPANPTWIGDYTKVADLRGAIFIADTTANATNAVGNPIVSNRYRVIHDKTYNVTPRASTISGNPPSAPGAGSVHINETWDFHGAEAEWYDGSAANGLCRGALYLMMWSDLAAGNTNPSFYGLSSLTFTDA